MIKTTKTDIQTIFEMQQANQWEIRKTTAEQRKEKIRKLSDVIDAHKEEIMSAVLKDVKKPLFEVLTAEIVGTKSSINKAISDLDKWMEPVIVQTNNPQAKGQILYEPKGVCCIFGPWNYPFTLLIQPLVEAIAAGNCCMLKPSDMTPAIGEVTSKIIESVFSKEEVAVIQGDVETANHLLELPFNHIFFTGSTNVGKIVMEAAAKNLASVTLELGGKSPVIVDSNTDLKRVAMRLAWGKMMNSGQTCIAPDYAFIKEEKLEEFINNFQQSVNEALKDESGKYNDQDRTQIVNERNYSRVKSIFNDAIEKGAKVVVGGEFDDTQLLISPTILTNITDDMEMMHEELFSPLLPIIIYEDVSEITKRLNKLDKPLALYIFSEDKEFVKYILSHTASGDVCVNDIMLHNAEFELPFGGSNTSGIGSYHGYHGFKEFSHARSVLYSVPNPHEAIMNPPYEGKIKMLLAKK